MKLSPTILTILKNFSSINEGIVVKPGNVLSTVSLQKNILVDAQIDEEIPQEFAIHKLSNFLSVASLFKAGAELDFDDKHIIIKGMGGRSKIYYRFASPTMVVGAPDKRPNLKEVDVEFNLTEDDLNWILKSASVLQTPNISVISDGNTVSLYEYNARDDSVNTNYLELPGVQSNGHSYKLNFKTEYLKLLPGNYNVQISSRGIARFFDSEKNITYYITLEKNSEYN